jgi:hypothetical protein
MGSERLNPGPVRRRTTRLPASAPQDEEPALSSEGREFVGQPALADPRFPGQQEQRASPGLSFLESGDELGQLPLTSDEHPPGTGRLGSCRLGHAKVVLLSRRRRTRVHLHDFTILSGDLVAAIGELKAKPAVEL